MQPVVLIYYSYDGSLISWQQTSQPEHEPIRGSKSTTCAIEEHGSLEVDKPTSKSFV